MSSQTPDLSDPPRKRSRALSCLGLLAVALVALLILVRIGVAAWHRLVPEPVVEPPPTTVEVVVLEPRSFERTVPVAGTLAPIHDVAVFPKVGGKVVEVYVGLGDSVTAGQALARVETVEYGLQAKQAEVGLDMARQAADLAGRAYQRVDTVHQQLGEDALALQSLEEAEIQAEGAKTQAEVARLNRDLARRVVDNATMRAPVDGHVTKVWARLGSMVGNEFPAFQIADTSELVLRCEVGDLDLPVMAPGQPARLHADALPNLLIEGQVAAVSTALDSMTRRAPVEISVPNPDERIIGNVFGRGLVVASTWDQALVVPAEAVSVSDTGASVFLEVDGVAQSAPVTILARTNGEVALQGLEAGDRVILPGSQRLIEGEAVAGTVRSSQGS